jgi:hypothetical protein
MRGDLHYADTAAEELARICFHDGSAVAYDEWTPTSDAQAEAFTSFRTLMTEGKLVLPNDARLIAQIRRVTSRPMPGGRVMIVLPRQGSAHGDLLMAVVLACVQVPLVEVEKAPVGHVFAFDDMSMGE